MHLVPSVQECRAAMPLIEALLSLHRLNFVLDTHDPGWVRSFYREAEVDTEEVGPPSLTPNAVVGNA